MNEELESYQVQVPGTHSTDGKLGEMFRNVCDIIMPLKRKGNVYKTELSSPMNCAEIWASTNYITGMDY